MRILVTGGCGFIGSNFIKYMLDEHKDYKITNIDKLTYAGKRENLIENLIDYQYNGNYYFVQGDINEIDLVAYIIKERQIDTIINFAAETHVDNSIHNPDEFIKTNINGTYNLLSMFYEFPKQLKRFIQISTDEVYGSLIDFEEPFTEENSIAPNSPYAASKASSDMLCRSFNKTYDYPIIITRCSNNYGPNQHSEKFIPTIIDRIKNNEKIPVYGNGKNVRDWVHVRDHCEAIDVVLHKGKDGEIYNIGGENEKTNMDIVNYILAGFGKDNNLIEYVNDRLGHDWRYAMDISKIKNKLGWKPKMDFEKEIKKLIKNEN